MGDLGNVEGDGGRRGVGVRCASRSGKWSVSECESPDKGIESGSALRF